MDRIFDASREIAVQTVPMRPCNSEARRRAGFTDDALTAVRVDDPLSSTHAIYHPRDGSP